MAKAKFYVVTYGREIGIFTSWAECEKQVKGFPSARYKSFSNLKDAESFLNGDLENTQVDNVKNKNEVLENYMEAYVDGSYCTKTKTYGSGVAVIKDGEVIEEIRSANNNSRWAEMRNVAGEIRAAMLAISYAINNGYANIVIYYDYQGIESWATGVWKCKRECTKEYKTWFDESKKYINVKFVKVKAHSENKFNELADKLASESLGR